MNSREEYIRRMKVKLEEWNIELDLLSDKAEKAAAGARNEFLSQIDALKGKQADTRRKIEELQHAGEGAWEDMKSGVELAWSAMGEAIDSARSRFK